MPTTRRAAHRIDVYLFPAIVGGGLGDISETLDAGTLLGRSGFPPRIFRRPGHPWPKGVRALLRDRAIPVAHRIGPRTDRAVTIAPMWGVSAAPARAEPLGRPGAWSEEAEEIERRYGRSHVLHVSLEEFARTSTSREETLERFREGGRPAVAARRFLATPRGKAELDAYRRAYRRFRAFDRANLLHLFPTFHPSRAFNWEYPEAIQTGPLWPARSWPRANAARSERCWVWYASPSTAVRLAGEVERALASARPPVRMIVRTPHPGPGWPASACWTVGGFLPPARWAREFAGAELRIVTGSRTLLEALELGGPFLYFNGVSGAGRHARRHRPEKIQALRFFLGRRGASAAPWRDLEAFSRGHRVASVVRRVERRLRDPTIPRPAGRAVLPDWDRSAGAVILRALRGWARSDEPAQAFATDFRASERARLLPSSDGPPAGGGDIRANTVAG